MAALLNILNPGDVGSRGVANELSERLSQELVIALVGPIGSGVSTAGQMISEVLSNQFNYKVAKIIKASDIIRQEAGRVRQLVPDRNDLSAYVDKMQTIGNELRKKFGPNYLAEKVVERIVSFRTDDGGFKDGIQLPGRRAYIVDSIKNVEELELLRRICGRTLCVFGVFAPDAIRRQRLEDSGAQSRHIDNIMNRDQGEVMTFGQMTRKIFVKADFFICNDGKVEELRNRLTRFLELLFDTNIHTPTNAESAMYKAQAVAANSACMSRQVGAAILSSKSELIAVGWNDVPKFSGGLYVEDDQNTWDETSKKIQDADNRCFKWKGRICHNETRRNEILDGISRRILRSGLVKRATTTADIQKILKGTEVDSLTEFSRSIHAEMEAILSVAREGRHSLAGATLFTTTYPCHNCARHIVASGIATVVYIEPYLKSLAISLHSDAVTEDPNDRSRVVFRQYDGVSPKIYSKVFRTEVPRKMQGKLYRPDQKTALPLFRIPLDGPADYEAKVIADLSQKEQ